MSGSAELHERASRIFLDACELEAAERSAFLDRMCAGDGHLRAEVEALLAHDDREDIFKTPVEGEPHAGPAVSIPVVPHRIGHYRILELIGEGGMGVVYRAEQDNPRRIVALKLIRPTFSGRNRRLLQRFKIEAEALGRLHHQGIAQIYEAGTFEEERPPVSGQRSEGRDRRLSAGEEALLSDLRSLTALSQPYFAMEYVEGRPLLQYANERRLNVRRRLELLMRICEACQHAHEHGVIHRDLKPANVLVDRSGQPKILDFGVARLTDSDVNLTTVATDVGQLVGTIPYMSPEQVAGDPHRVSARADVYALGVIAFELLTGRLPHALEGRTVPEAVRIISEVDPTPLSTVDRTLRGDLDTILSKALEKDAQRRYGSAEQLREDIRRYLDSEPIVARPTTTAYQLRKFAQRNRALVASIAVAFLGLGVLSILASAQAVRARQAEREAIAAGADAAEKAEEARRQAEIAEAINEFLNRDLLAAVAPSAEAGRGRDVPMRDVLDAASRRIDEAAAPGGRFAGKPYIEANIRSILGETYFKLGEYTMALPHLQRSHELLLDDRGEDDLETLATVNNLAVAFRALGRVEEAEQAYLAAMNGRRRALGEDHPLTLNTMTNYGVFLRSRDRLDECEALTRRALEGRRRVLGDSDPATLESVNNLAGVLRVRGDVDGALALYEQALEQRRRALGSDDRATLVTLSNLASLLQETGRLDEAEPLHAELIERRERVFGEHHPDTLRAYNNFGYFLDLLGRTGEAEYLYRKAHTGRVEALGEDHPDTLLSLNNLAQALGQLQRWEEAEACAAFAAENFESRFGMRHRLTLTAFGNHGRALAGLGRLEEAEERCRVALDGFLHLHGESHPRTLIALTDLAAVILERGSLDEAERLLREVAQRYEQSTPAAVHEPLRVRGLLAKVMLNTGRHEEAVEELRAALDLASERLGPEHPQTVEIADALAQLALDGGVDR